MRLLALFIPVLPFLGVSATERCNGHVSLCDRRYSNVTMIGAHNSPFVGQLMSDNQSKDVEEQLDRGIRFLQGQTHPSITGKIHLCHTRCILRDAGRLTNWLSRIKNWLDNNVDQVITLLLTNPNNFPIQKFAESMVDSGLAAYAYRPSKKLGLDEWPTLQEFINANSRLIMFLDIGADPNAIPYILDEWEYFFETPFTQEDREFSQCVLGRPEGGLSVGRMYLVNHTLNFGLLGHGVMPVPDRLHEKTTIAAQTILKHADLCLATWGRKPNVILVDRFHKGDVFTAQNILNGL
jgi:hypothetical protein